MNKYLSLILGIIAAITVAYSFFNPALSAKLLWFEVNIWIFRAFYAVLAALLIMNYFRQKNLERGTLEP